MITLIRMHTDKCGATSTCRSELLEAKQSNERSDAQNPNDLDGVFGEKRSNEEERQQPSCSERALVLDIPRPAREHEHSSRNPLVSSPTTATILNAGTAPSRPLCGSLQIAQRYAIELDVVRGGGVSCPNPRLRSWLTRSAGMGIVKALQRHFRTAVCNLPMPSKHGL